MADAIPPGAGGNAPSPHERRLESWGEIAGYLRREIRTVQRWERNLGLPVHRLAVGRQASVFAYPSELDKWFHERESRLKEDRDDDSSASIATPAAGNHAAEATTGGAGNSAASSATAAMPGGELLAEPQRTRVNRRVRWIAGLAILGVALMVVVGVKMWPPKHVPPGEKVRLFVRPFEAMQGDAAQQEFTEGLTDEINSQLGKLDPQHLGVIAPTSSRQFASRPIADLENLLSVQYVLEGKVRRANDKVSIDVFLISARDQTQVFSDSFTENLADVLKAQDEVAAAVAQKLLVNLPPSKSTVFAASVDPEGYAAYLRGRRYWSVRDLSNSVPAFEQAVKKLPGYAMAHSGLAASYAVMSEAPNDVAKPSDSAPKARSEAQRALELDAGNAEAHYVLGNLAMYYDLDFAAAERELRRAIALEPNSPTAHQWLGQYLMTQNRPAEAQTETLKALELDPVSPIFTTARAEAFYYARDFDSAIQEAKLTLEQSPNFVLAEFWLASGYREKKMYADAIQHFRTASRLAPGNPALLMALGHALGVSGDRQGARVVLSQLQELSQQRYVPAIYFAGVYVGLADKDSAFHYLDKAVNEHNDRLSYLAVEPIADPLRSDPRFPSLLVRVHLDRVKL